MIRIHGKKFEQMGLEYMDKNLTQFERASKKHDHYEGTDCYINDYPFDITLNPSKDNYIEIGYIYKNRYDNKKVKSKIKIGFRTGNRHHDFLIPVIVLDFSKNQTMDAVYEIIDNDLLTTIKNLLLDIKFLRDPDYAFLDDTVRYNILKCESRFGYFCDLFDLTYVDALGVMHTSLSADEFERIKSSAEQRWEDSLAIDMGLTYYNGEYIPYGEEDAYDQLYDEYY